MKRLKFYSYLILIIFLFPCLHAHEDNYYNKILNAVYNHLPLKIKNKIDKDYFYSGYNKSINEINNRITFIKIKDRDKWLFETCNAKINEIIFLKNFHPSKSLISYQIGKLAGYISAATNPFISNNKILESFEDEVKIINFSNNPIINIKRADLINKIEETADLNLFDSEQLQKRYDVSENVYNKKIKEIFSSILNRSANLIKNEIYSLFVIFEDEKNVKLTIRDFIPFLKSEKKSTIEKPKPPTPPSKPELKQIETKKENIKK